MDPKRILVVDDEDDIREVASMSLETISGYAVITARSGVEAIRLAQTEHPDAILLDVMMPEMDGPSTFRQLQSMPETSSIPVILLTAKVQANDRAKFASMGVAGVLPKPFDPMTLGAQVAEVLGWESA